MTYALGNVSGAYFNPAVTAAVYLVGRNKDFSFGTAFKFMVMQFAGGFAGAIAFSSIRNGDSFALGPGVDFGWIEVALAEAIFTFVLCYAVLSVFISDTTR